MPRKAFGLHVSKVQPEAHVRASAKRHIRVAVPVSLHSIGESCRIETFRLGPVLGQMMGVERVHPDKTSRRNRIAPEHKIACRASDKRWHGRVNPSGKFRLLTTSVLETLGWRSCNRRSMRPCRASSNLWRISKRRLTPYSVRTEMSSQTDDLAAFLSCLEVSL
jgi:hypothetical protein